MLGEIKTFVNTKTKKEVLQMLVIERERKLRGISQSKLAQRADMHPSSVCAIERGNLIPFRGQREKLERVMREVGWDGNGDLFSEVSDDGTA
jgi:ribosome-binding protein aMBF1 (putative translation factor)